MTDGTRSGVRSGTLAVDPLWQSSPGTLPLDGPLLTFEGLGNRDNIAVAGGSAVPPDTTGDVGPRHYVQAVNVSFAIYSRTGDLLLGPVPGNALYRGFGGPCEARNDGDPIVAYDHLADRWVLTQFALPNFPNGPFFQCVAVSTSPDPTGAYFRYAFQAGTDVFNDYPKLSVWPDGYYYTHNAFQAGSLAALGGSVGVLERDRMLAGEPAGFLLFDPWRDDPRYFGFLPADLDGPAPPRGAPGLFVSADDDIFGWPNDRLTLFELRVRWGGTPSGQLLGPVVLRTAPFDSNLCGFSVSCIPQRDTTRRLDALSDRAMSRLQYRNFGSHESLVLNLTVDVDETNHAGIRWFELRRAPGGAWSIFQEGTYGPDRDHRWMGSTAMDRLGNLALGYSVSGVDLFPGIRYAGRAPTDPLGTLARRERSIVEGGGAQSSATSRWGDYSALVVDPRDDCTFFYTNEYYATTSERLWQTRVGTFRFPGCTREEEAAVTVERGVMEGQDDTPRRLTEEQRQQRERTNQLGLDDERTEGNVVGLDCATTPPTVTIANRDGEVTVRLIGDAAGFCASIRVGDYLEAAGVKEHEQLFDAESVEVSRPRPLPR